MPKLHDKRVLPYTHKQLFDLVMDVESYPDFLPFCIGSKVLSRAEDSREVATITAELTIKAGFFTKCYTSLITPSFCEKEAGITVTALSGPFKRLDNLWLFKPYESATEVEFSLDFEFESLMLSKMMGGMMSEAYTKMINAFEKRARYVYDNQN